VSGGWGVQPDIVREPDKSDRPYKAVRGVRRWRATCFLSRDDGSTTCVPGPLPVHHAHGRDVEFREQFHKMFAKSQNALRGRWENLWASEEPCVVEVLGREDLLDKLVYVATNPTSAAAPVRIRSNRRLGSSPRSPAAAHRIAPTTALRL
jgi:hypothetical protein